MTAVCACGTAYMPLARMTVGDDGVTEFHLTGARACVHCDTLCGHTVDMAPLVGESDVAAWERQMAQASQCTRCSTTRKTVRLIKRD